MDKEPYEDVEEFPEGTYSDSELFHGWWDVVSIVLAVIATVVIFKVFT